MKVPAIQRLREVIYRLSNLVAFVFSAALLLWLSPGSEFLREAGLKDDLIRMSMLVVAAIPALMAGSFIRMIVGTPAQAATK
ncbi:hypothetical protein LDZ95_21215 [Pseudomonas aeruginosa]|uniref:hypothetical protein n=1 Tax=Pseudomonas aeruginosa TaxID=287 RepID=UPI0005B8AF9F|nr:hypothetical protein [Pseudomonas aeruginosa]MBV6140075.1 hypothetical protein [Pseudomonas aeruginosa]MCA4044906.1 hypothetical protein [Pseudomonas aeruginosa]OZO13427.1 hypothetical protein CGU42_33040 [Pseudomonas aeruginosa]RPW15246.1 hypothetical protein IPC752_27190 [Pseudomonas aeruginosa]RUG33811.1 hypothetical protein IPC760_30105 [Pseudomonas aeruginosa]